MVPAKRSGFPVIKKSGNLSFFATFLPSPVSNIRIPPRQCPWQCRCRGKGKRNEPFKLLTVMIDWTAVLIVTGVCVVMPVVIVAVTFKQKERAIDRKMDVLSKAVENGQEIDPALFADEKSSKSLKLRLINRATWGVVLSVVAIVMLACALFVNDDPEGMVISGGIILAAGIGMLFSFFAGKRWLTPEIEADEMRLRAEAEKARRILSGTDTDSRA